MIGYVFDLTAQSVAMMRDAAGKLDKF